MKKIQGSILAATIGIVTILIYFTPLKYFIEQDEVHFGSIADRGFIDYGRLLLMIGTWVLISFCLSFIPNLSVLFHRIFSWLQSNRNQLFMKIVSARLIDLSILTLITIFTTVVFDFIVDSVALTTYIFLTIFSLLIWFLYFVFFFKNGKTIGHKVLKLEYEKLPLKKSLRIRLLFKELIYTIPLFSYFIIVGILNYLAFYNDNYDRNIESTYIFWPAIFIVCIIFPLSSLTNKNLKGPVEYLTKLKLKNSM